MAQATIPDYNILGPDVSTYQKDVKWEDVSNQSAVGFALCKATEGTQHIDSFFNRNITQMKTHLSSKSRTFGVYTHPIAVGVYHFADINPSYTTSDYENQAQFFYNTAHTYHPDFWMLDWEDKTIYKGQTSGGDSMNKDEKALHAKEFCVKLHQLLMSKYSPTNPNYIPKIFIYVGYYYWGSPNVSVVEPVNQWFGTYGPKLWIASYPYASSIINPPPPSQAHHDTISTDIKLNVPHFQATYTKPNSNIVTYSWSMWQYTSQSRVPGVTGNCDLSVARDSITWHYDFYQ